MELLQKRIAAEGKILGNGILKIDSLINHQVDPAIMDACGREFAALFAKTGATRILTAEISGIAPALMTGYHCTAVSTHQDSSHTIRKPSF